MNFLNMKLKIKFKLFISVSDFAKAEDSQKMIDELKILYKSNMYGDEEQIKVTSFGICNGELKGIYIIIRCINMDEAKKYKKEFNTIYKHKIEGLESKPILCISLLDLERFQILNKF